ncbi:hypothetical protein CSW74_27755, partial [Shigella sonnei]
WDPSPLSLLKGKRLVRIILIFTEKSDQLSKATDLSDDRTSRVKKLRKVNTQELPERCYISPRK